MRRQPAPSPSHSAPPSFTQHSGFSVLPLVLKQATMPPTMGFATCWFLCLNCLTGFTLLHHFCLQVSAKSPLSQGNLHGRLYFPKVVLTISPIPYSILQHDFATHPSRGGVKFPTPLSLGGLSDLLEQRNAGEVTWDFRGEAGEDLRVPYGPSGMATPSWNPVLL